MRLKAAPTGVFCVLAELHC